jgi:hypothetical protein
MNQVPNKQKPSVELSSTDGFVYYGTLYALPANFAFLK